MKWLLVLSLALFGEFVIAAVSRATWERPVYRRSNFDSGDFHGDFPEAAVVPEITSQMPPMYRPVPNSSNRFASAIQSKSQLVKSLKSKLKDVNLLEKLLKDTERFDDYAATYTPSVQALLTELRPLIITAGDNVFDAIRPVHGWCGQAKELLEAFLSLYEHYDDESIRARGEILIKLLDEDFTRPLLEKLDRLITQLNEASRSVTYILIHFESDFTERSFLFESLLREELIRVQNKRYKADLVNTATRSLVQFGRNVTQSIDEIVSEDGALKIAQTILDQQQTYDPLYANQQHQPRAPSTQTVMQCRNRVLLQFQQTHAFWRDFANELEIAKGRVNEIMERVLRSNQPGQTLQGMGNVETNDSLLKGAANSLMSKCKSFNATPL